MLLIQVAIDVNATTVMELIGINIAANSGDIRPKTATLIPMILYIKLMRKVSFTIAIASWQR